MREAIRSSKPLGRTLLRSVAKRGLGLVAELERLEADGAVLDRYQDGITNVLCVGRLAPVWQDGADLLETFAHYQRSLNAVARLFIVLPDETPHGSAVANLQKAVDRVGLTDICCLAVDLSLAQLKAYYLISHAVLCVSSDTEVGDYLVPALEYRIPIIAWATPAVRAMLGEDALAWDVVHPALLAEGLHHCLADRATASVLLAHQLRRLERIRECASR